MLQPAFNLVGPSASLGGSAIMTIVNGPIAETLQINSRNNLFGAGNRANATIGRAVRLVLMNTCGAIPGLFDRSCLGHPGKYTYCIAENAADSPWLPLHAERGFQVDDNAGSSEPPTATHRRKNPGGVAPPDSTGAVPPAVPSVE
jgi:hypothetical protein